MMSNRDTDKIIQGLEEAARIDDGRGGAAQAQLGGAEPETDTERRLRQLLLELYVSGVLWHDDLPNVEQQRLLDTVLAAAEGREFADLGLPFPTT